MSNVIQSVMPVVVLVVFAGLAAVSYRLKSAKARKVKIVGGYDRVSTGAGRPRRGPVLLLWGGGGAGFGERLRDALKEEGVRDLVTLDGDFLARRDIGSSSTLVTVVDGSWLRWRGGDGSPDRPRDALQAALAAEIPVIPVVPDGERMPTATELPPALKELARLNGHPVHEDSWTQSVHRLADGLRS